MTDQEKKEIVSMVMEEMFSQIPAIIGNMMKNHGIMNKLNHQLYTQHPEFKDHKDVVCAVIEEVELNNFGMAYEDILEKAVPIIHKRLQKFNALPHRPVMHKAVIHNSDNGVL